MNARAAHLIAALGLTPHPEGGYYRELYRATGMVRPEDGRPPRPALTTIYFLLAAGQVSCWHRVLSDEVWHHYEGAPLELRVTDGQPAAGGGAPGRRVLVGPVAAIGDAASPASTMPVFTVPAGWWQAARSTGAYTLVGCTVGPGFDFADFAMLRDVPDAQAAVLGSDPEAARFL